jgi:hypothetical protein
VYGSDTHKLTEFVLRVLLPALYLTIVRQQLYVLNIDLDMESPHMQNAASMQQLAMTILAKARSSSGGETCCSFNSYTLDVVCPFGMFVNGSRCGWDQPDLVHFVEASYKSMVPLQIVTGAHAYAPFMSMLIIFLDYLAHRDVAQQMRDFFVLPGDSPGTSKFHDEVTEEDIKVIKSNITSSTKQGFELASLLQSCDSCLSDHLFKSLEIKTQEARQRRNTDMSAWSEKIADAFDYFKTARPLAASDEKHNHLYDFSFTKKLPLGNGMHRLLEKGKQEQAVFLKELKKTGEVPSIKKSFVQKEG